MENQYRAIAIDGPAGAGKSTIAKALAARLGYIYVDTGALYRAVAYHVLAKGIDPKNERSVTACLPEISVDLRYENGEQRVYLNDADVSKLIRTPEISMGASAVSAFGSVRSLLLDLQRNIARHNNVIMDGRDIATVVLPWAQVKIFLTASAEERAQRRYDELCQKGQKVTYHQVLDDVKERDYNDSHRAIAPLKPAPDAKIVDTTGNTLEQSIEQLYRIVIE